MFAVNKRQNTNYSFLPVTSKVSCIWRKRGQIICLHLSCKEIINRWPVAQTTSASRILKDLQNFTAPILTIIFQKSLQAGCIPSDWKHANVAPAYKKGEKYNAANYRPISLSCISCKIMEHVITG